MQHSLGIMKSNVYLVQGMIAKGTKVKILKQIHGLGYNIYFNFEGYLSTIHYISYRLIDLDNKSNYGQIKKDVINTYED